MGVIITLGEAAGHCEQCVANRKSVGTNKHPKMNEASDVDDNAAVNIAPVGTRTKTRKILAAIPTRIRI